MSQIKHSFGDGPMVLSSNLLLVGIVPNHGNSEKLGNPTETSDGMSHFRFGMVPFWRRLLASACKPGMTFGVSRIFAKMPPKIGPSWPGWGHVGYILRVLSPLVEH
jgi:hypothetical protein